MSLAPSTSSMFTGYSPLPGTYDELFSDVSLPRPGFREIVDAIGARTPAEFERAQALVDLTLLYQGVTFSVYADTRGQEKIFPVCVVPRVIGADEWRRLERGLEQRIRALSLFLDDVYGDQRIVREKRIPVDLVRGARSYIPGLHGLRPPGGVRIHIAGIDLVRDGAGTFRVLEDNLRTPSGVSYVVTNRLVTKRVLSGVFESAHVHRVYDYPNRLARSLLSVSPRSSGGEGYVVLLTPGPYNSAYFEHSFLARLMGIELVQAADLFVDRDMVWARTTRGPRRVHVIYRRTDDQYLDPEVFRPDSVLGVRGLMRAYAAGNVTLANAPGNSVADDKAIYPFVPEMIRFYLSEEPLLPQVETYVCLRDEDRRYVLEHLPELVVKAVDEAGGYGMLMGPQASVRELDDFRRRIQASPRSYIAQHRIELSTCPTWDGATQRLVPRRVDFRPYIVTGANGPWVLPGGLTRVALVEGSYVVNSSQGGGSKDTWVLKSNGRAKNGAEGRP